MRDPPRGYRPWGDSVPSYQTMMSRRGLDEGISSGGCLAEAYSAHLASESEELVRLCATVGAGGKEARRPEARPVRD